MIDFTSPTNTSCSSSRSANGARARCCRYIRENDRKHHFDRERILGGMAKLGLLGISVPQEYGGAGMDYIALGIASEELEYLDTSLRVDHVGARRAELPVAARRGAPKIRSSAIWCRRRRARRSPATASPSRAPAATRARIQTTATKKGDRYVLNGEKTWISLADVADNFLVIAWTDLEKKKKGDPVRHDRLHRRAHVQGLLERRDEGEVGHPRRRHRLLQDGRRRGAGGEHAGQARRGLQDRDVLARPGALHRRRRRDRADPRLPRRQREVREGAQDVRRRDRPAPAREGNDRAAWSPTTRRRGCSGCAPAG